MFKNFENFTYSSMDNFPVKECTIQSEEEPNVFDAETFYQILYIDIRFPKEKFIAYAKPYICKEDDGITKFGWASTHTSQIFGNVENSCQFYDEFVVGFIRADAEYQEADKKCFDNFKAIIEAQYQ